MATVEAFAPAKINLTLHVTGQRADGYHLLDSLVVFADVGDRLWLTPGDVMHLDVTGPFAAGVPGDPANLIWRAAIAAEWCGTIRLEKNLPHGAGIGGGSADAAALLRALFGDDAKQGIGLDRALALGADVPVCLHAGPQRMQGVGERLTRIRPVPELFAVLINPGVPLATPHVFRALDRRDNAPMTDCDGWKDPVLFVDWLRAQRNDLQEAACRLAPEVALALQELAGADVARMSGSGGTCFGLFGSKTEARSAARRIAARHPHWWVKAATTVGSTGTHRSRATT